MAIRARTFAHRRKRAADDGDRRWRLPAGERHAIGQRGRRAAGERRESLIELLVESGELLPRVALRRQHQLRGEDARRLEAGLHALQPREAGQQQTSGDEQHQRQRHFDDQQAGAQTPARSDRAAARFLERFEHVHARRLECRQQADRQTGDEGREQRKAQGDRVDPDFGDTRNQIRAEGDERTQRPLGQQHAGGAAEHGQEHAFGHELAHHLASARAEREARGDLAPARGKAREQQVGDVRARDQEHAADGAEEQQITLTLRADGILEQRHDLDPRRRIDVRGVRRSVAGGDHVHRLARLLQRDARLEPCDDLKEIAAVVQLRRGEIRHLRGSGHPDLQLIQGERRRRLRQHADDGVRRAVERERLSEDRRIAVEALLPHGVADQRDALAAGSIFIRREVAPEQRLESECG